MNFCFYYTLTPHSNQIKTTKQGKNLDKRQEIRHNNTYINYSLLLNIKVSLLQLIRSYFYYLQPHIVITTIIRPMKTKSKSKKRERGQTLHNNIGCFTPTLTPSHSVHKH